MTFRLKYACDLARPFRRTISALSLCALVALAGCGGDDFAASENNSVLFSPLRTQSAVPKVVEDPDAPADDGIEEIQAIVADFEKGMMPDGSAGAQAPPSMADLESKFIQRGRYLDLVGIYQNMIKKNTVQPNADEVGGRARTSTGPIELRLARAYLRLGQTHLAREILDKMIRENADAPMTWFLNAAYWLPEAVDSEDAAARVIVNWQKALEIDPSFIGFDQANAPPLKDQLAVLRARTPVERIAVATAELHKKMNPNAVEKSEQDVARVPGEQDDSEPVDVADTESLTGQDSELADEPKRNPAQVKQADSLPAQATQENAKPQRIPYMMAHANMALAQGKPAQAVRLFEQVLARESDHFGAQFGLIRAGWMDNAQRPALAQSLRQIAARTDLKPREQLEVGRLVYYNLQDRDLAIKLWERVKKQNPALAKSVGLDALIVDAKRLADSE